MPSEYKFRSEPAPKTNLSSAPPPVLSPNVILLPLVSNAPPSCGEVSATRAVSTTANVESPLKKVEELAVPVSYTHLTLPTNA